MSVEYIVLNIIVLFGAIQGFTLCLYLLFQRKDNTSAFRYYLLFLFSLSFHNLVYAFVYSGINAIGSFPLTSFPYPYRYLIAVGFYFYIKSQVKNSQRRISKYEYLLFIPAVIYGLLRTYWYVKLHVTGDKDIFWNVYQTGFFTYNDFVYLTFSITIILIAIRFLKDKTVNIKGSISKVKNWKWLIRFSWILISFLLLNLLHRIFSLILELQDSVSYYYVILILNTIYIYYIGLIGYTKSNFLFKSYELKEDKKEEILQDQLEMQLNHLLRTEEVYTKKDLKVQDLADILEVTAKELSVHIHQTHQMSFNDYINSFRVEKVKKLIVSPDKDKYTMQAIAEMAGFSSKSSFNAVFKKVTGITPSKFKKNHS